MNVTKMNQPRWRIAIPLLTIAFVLSTTAVLFLQNAPTYAATKTSTHLKVPFTSFKDFSYGMAQSGTKPPTDAQCRQQFGSPCYSPQEIRRSYGIDGLLSRGFNGQGQTIVIVDSFGSPTIVSDLHVFDQGYGLPDPPSLKIYAPLGTKPFDPNNATMVNWAFETTLDVEWAHAIAPGASIALMTSPVPETQGIQGMPQFLYLEKYALAHNLGKIISQSWATTENTLFYTEGRQVFTSFNDFYQQAAADHVTVFGSSGDGGVANPNFNGTIYPFPTVNFPASSPYVTAVGGTSLMATTNGTYQSETAWNGSGGGVSQYWAEPSYQRDNLDSSNQSILKGMRGLPDISYNADPNTSILVYLSFITPGYYAIGGTSEGSPQWAGLIADGNQYAGHPLGFLNTSLYQIGHSNNYAESYHDITSGNNSANGIAGYNATPGWDPVTGWGSPKATTLIMEIIQEQH